MQISCGLLYRKVPTLQQTEHISLVNGIGELRCRLLLCGRRREAHEGGSGSGQALWQNGIQDNGQEEDRRPTPHLYNGFLVEWIIEHHLLRVAQFCNLESMTSCHQGGNKEETMIVSV